MCAEIRTIWDVEVVIDLGAGRYVLFYGMYAVGLLVSLAIAYSSHGQAFGYRKPVWHAPCLAFPALLRKAVVAEEAKAAVVVLKLYEQTEAAPVCLSHVAQTWRAGQLEKPARSSARYVGVCIGALRAIALLSSLTASHTAMHLLRPPQLANELFPLPAKVWEVAGLKAPDAEEQEDAAASSTQAGLDAEIAALKSKPVSTSSRFVDAHLNVKTSVLLVPHPGLEAAALALAGSPDGPAVPLYNPYRCVLTTADEPPVFDSAQCSAHDAVPGACTVDVCLLVRTLLERIAAGDMVLRVCQRILPMPITTYPDVPRCAAAVARLAPGWMQAVASQRAALPATPAPFSVCVALSAGQM